MLLILFTFLITTALYAVLLWLAVQRIVRHLKNNPEGVKAVTDHVLLPMLGKDQPGSEEAKPATAEVKDKKKGILV